MPDFISFIALFIASIVFKPKAKDNVKTAIVVSPAPETSKTSFASVFVFKNVTDAINAVKAQDPYNKKAILIENDLPDNY